MSEATDQIIGRPDKPFHKGECQCAECRSWIAANPLPGESIAIPTPPAASAATAVGMELPDDSGAWFRNGQLWIAMNHDEWMAYKVDDGALHAKTAFDRLPKGGWTQAMPATEVTELRRENERIKAELAEVRNLNALLDDDRRRITLALDRLEDELAAAEKERDAARAEIHGVKRFAGWDADDDGPADSAAAEMFNEIAELKAECDAAIEAKGELLAACKALLEASRAMRGEFVFTKDITAKTLGPMFNADDQAQAAIVKAE